jgi:large subunit ribosomal protein L35
MSKLKTHKGIAKRFKLTREGKVKYSRCGKGHLLSGKSAKKKRQMRRKGFIRGQQQLQIKKMLPYISR